MGVEDFAQQALYEVAEGIPRHESIVSDRMRWGKRSVLGSLELNGEMLNSRADGSQNFPFMAMVAIYIWDRNDFNPSAKTARAWLKRTLRFWVEDPGSNSNEDALFAGLFGSEFPSRMYNAWVAQALAHLWETAKKRDDTRLEELAAKALRCFFTLADFCRVERWNGIPPRIRHRTSSIYPGQRTMSHQDAVSDIEFLDHTSRGGSALNANFTRRLKRRRMGGSKFLICGGAVRVMKRARDELVKPIPFSHRAEQAEAVGDAMQDIPIRTAFTIEHREHGCFAYVDRATHSQKSLLGAIIIRHGVPRYLRADDGNKIDRIKTRVTESETSLMAEGEIGRVVEKLPEGDTIARVRMEPTNMDTTKGRYDARAQVTVWD